MLETIPKGTIEYIFKNPHYKNEDSQHEWAICDQVLDYMLKHRSLSLETFLNRWGRFFDIIYDTESDIWKDWEWTKAQAFKYRRRDKDSYSFFVNYDMLTKVKENKYVSGNVGTLRMEAGESC